MGTDDAAAAAAAAAAGGGDAWHKGADADTLGFLQTRGWDKVDAKDAAFNAIKSYREAEKVIGAPPDQVLRFPKDANDAAAWAKVYERLGVGDATKYDFSAVKHEDGEVIGVDLQNSIRSLAGEAKLTPSQAQAVGRSLAKMLDEADKTEVAEYNGKLAVEKDTLAKNWGYNAAAFKVIAENAAKRAGLTVTEISALEKTIGYARVMDMFRVFGQRTGEDQFVTNSATGGKDIISAQQAEAQLNSLMADTAWVEKYLNGDTQAVQQFDNLTRIKAGV
jgi:hypothetical protein